MWYLIPPSPDYGQFAWESPADNQSELNENRLSRMWHNEIEGLNPGDGDEDKTIPSQIFGDLFSAAQRTVPRRDPLTLDLDGDGLETVPPSSTDPILFDHEGDGVKTGTGWVSADDGFLVLDRDGNGSIDSGRELFGDSTPLFDAEGNEIGKAEDGFAALAQEDTNADGVVDAQDARWAELRVWQDLNQDGVSQADELKTLDELGIAGISVAKTEYSQVLPGGNEIADLGTFIRSDGSTGSMGTTSTLADVNLAADTFYRSFDDTIPTTAETEALPDMQACPERGRRGSGMVRDLREAASIQSEAGSELADLLGQYAATDTHSGKGYRMRRRQDAHRRRMMRRAPRRMPCRAASSQKCDINHTF
jgi:hypothetical protein